MEENQRRELVGIAPAGEGEFINIYQLDLSNPESLLKLKPATWPLSDEDWVLSAAMIGIAHSWNHDFQEYVKCEIAAGRLPETIRPTKCFGEIGKEGYELARGDWEEFIAYMTSENWRLEKLGVFGEWMKKAKIHPGYAREIIKEYLED